VADRQTRVVPVKAATSGVARGVGKVPVFAGTTLLFASLTACTSVQLPAGPAPLDPIAFFIGETRGTGTLNPVLGRSVPITVESRGTRDGAKLRLVQRITEGDKPPRTRVWAIRKVTNGYVSTLTDAQGMVIVEVNGPRAYIGYTTPSGLRIRQQLALQPDGRTLLNRLEAYKYGLRVATLDETIRK
jgi:hypothetical protein